MDLNTELQLVKKQLTDLIIQHLEENKITVDRSRQLAREFLAALPVASHQDLLDKLKQLGEKHEEAQEVYVAELGKISNQQKEDALNTMRNAIQQGNIEKAVETAKTISTTQ